MVFVLFVEVNESEGFSEDLLDRIALHVYSRQSQTLFDHPAGGNWTITTQYNTRACT